MDGRPIRARNRNIAAAIAALLAVGVVACGGDDEGTDEARSTPAEQETEEPLSPAEQQGRELFVANCGSCHTLDAAGTDGQVGPNLDEAQVDAAEALAKIKEGPGVMPENLVEGEEAQAVAEFVAASGPGS
jgi:mono/diheme cytochrome c family protein